MDKKAYNGCEILLKTCAGAKPGEKVVIVTDDTSFAIGQTMYEHTSKYTDTTLLKMTDRQTHGSSPTAAVAAAMAAADIIFGATTFSLYNTPERINACKGGSRFVNMSDYSMAMLEHGCLFTDFEQSRKRVESTQEKILGSICTITTLAGTNLTASIQGREAVSGFGVATQPGMAASPPNIETAVGPITAQGVIVVDGSIPLPGLGPIKEPITITVKEGRITEIAGGKEAQLLEKSLRDIGDERVYVVAEIGFGMNAASSISGRMLEDEGVFGTMHIGIGNNLAYGGDNAISVHIDMIMMKPTYVVDGKMLYKDGEIVG